MPRHIVIHPDVWDDLADDPEAKAAFQKMLDVFNQAAANMGDTPDPDGSRFAAEVERLGGGNSKRVSLDEMDELTEEQKAQLEARAKDKFH